MSDTTPVAPDPVLQIVLIDAEIDPDRMIFENIPMDRSPQFSISELCKVFFAKTHHWLRWKERMGAFVLDGHELTQRTEKGARTWNLAEVEQMLHAAARNNAISGAQLYGGLKIAKTIAVLHGVLVEPTPNMTFSVDTTGETGA